MAATANASQSYPAYTALLETGVLEKRAHEAISQLAECRVCPRRCNVNRLENKRGFCRTGRMARVASYFPHLGEEDCLRGWGGSGTIFFSGCNLRCVFCQNWDISQCDSGREVTASDIAAMMLELQEAGAHNINWVSPSHVVPQMLEATALAAQQGLRLPIVYNSGGYDSVQALKWLDGVVDIYMPDFKYWDAEKAGLLSAAPDYPEVARQAIREMHRQVGVLKLDARGLARRGLLIRHLVLPNGMAGTSEIASWLATEISPKTYINIMNQYHPDGALLRAQLGKYPRELCRTLTIEEYVNAMRAARAAGLSRFDERRTF
ncbi:MAG: radical SAM protein [Verrucomicrobiota bacterium]|jgi:putative pyruvate formate lyase activating enzyme|nr:radical SAM protein [Verrucomicrobiota bacterium]